MPPRVCTWYRWSTVVLAALFVAVAAPAIAQSVSLAASDATLRGGIYADTNFGTATYFETKASTSPDFVRHAVLKFDTHTTIPAGSTITSAVLTLTVKSGSVASRRIGVYCVPSSFDENQTTWRLRKGTLYWRTPGGDTAHQHGTATVTNVAGSKVIVDVTAITREAMQTSSRYTRVLLADVDSTATASYIAYYSNQADSGLRPTLVVTYAPPVVTGTAGTTLRLLQWNVAQGWGTDGKPNLDRVVDWVIRMNPDVISFNEILHYTSATSDQVKLIADRLTARTGKTWTYKWIQKWGAATGEGEAVMSRLPFVSTASYLLPFTRAAAEAMVMVNGRAVNVASTHLDPDSSTYRLAQIAELKRWMATFAQQRIIMGDFNSWPGTSEITEMTKDHKDAWAEAVKGNLAVAYPDNPDGNTRRSRIDFVFYSTGATALVLQKAQVFDTRDAAGQRPSDHNPLVVTFEVR